MDWPIVVLILGLAFCGTLCFIIGVGGAYYAEAQKHWAERPGLFGRKDPDG